MKKSDIKNSCYTGGRRAGKGARNPKSEVQRLGNGEPKPDTSVVSRPILQLRPSRFLKPGRSGNSHLQTFQAQHKTRNPQQSPWNPNQSTRNPEQSTRNPNQSTCNPQQSTRNLKPINMEPETINMEQRCNELPIYFENGSPMKQ